jgi:hypothetical protein
MNELVKFGIVFIAYLLLVAYIYGSNSKFDYADYIFPSLALLYSAVVNVKHLISKSKLR